MLPIRAYIAVALAVAFATVSPVLSAALGAVALLASSATLWIDDFQ